MVKIVTVISPKRFKGKYRINSYTPNGNMVNADWYYTGAPRQIVKPSKKWHKLVNIDMRKYLAEKYPAKRFKSGVKRGRRAR